MPPLTLPLTFSNSFWSQDYRTGLEVLYAKIEQGIAENEEILNFIKARVRAERELSQTLGNPPPVEAGAGVGFGADDGASLYMAFRGLQHQSVDQGKAHGVVAKDLQEQVVDPFEVWSYKHGERIQASKEDIVDGWVARYETHIADVNKVRETYLTKCRKADEAEDDAKFAGISAQQEADKLAEAPKHLAPNNTLRRTPSFAEKLTARLNRSREPSPSRPPHMASPRNTIQMFDADTDEHAEKAADDGKSDGTVTPKVDKGKGKEVSASPTMMSPTLPDLAVNIPPASPTVTTHIVVGNSSIDASQISALLFRAQQEIGVRSVKFTLLGEYDQCFTGEEFVVWLKMNVEALEGSLDAAGDAAKVLTEEYGALRRIGELGNKFDNSPTAWFQFRPKAFNLQAALQPKSQTSVDSGVSSPIVAAQAGVKRSNTMVSYIVKAVQNATAPTQPDELPYVKARKEAGAADLAYRKAAKQLDQHRCTVEEKVDEILKALQRWELERLKAVKTVLLQYQGILASLNGPIGASNETSSILISSFMPESDIKALIERYRTGPFRPEPKLYESVTHETEVSFGIDLRKWAGEGAFSPMRSIGSIDEMNAASGARDLPPVLVALLGGLERAYTTVESDLDQRMIWIYEVPLQTVHQLRALLNALPFDKPMDAAIFEAFDPPVLASVLKLWLLELNPPVANWEGWDDVKKVYPSVGAEAATSDAELEEQLKTVLAKLPMVSLKVLDAVVSHIRDLVDSTETEEANDVYITKVALSMGRSIIRPRQETSMSIQGNHAHTFFADLVKHYSGIMPDTLERKRRESVQRAAPKRQRTKMVDARQMRRSVDVSADPRKLLEAQYMLKNPTSRPSSPGPPNFISPPSSPPGSGAQGILPPITTTAPPEEAGLLLKADGEGTPSVSLEPPSPINLTSSPRKEFVAPPPPPPIASPLFATPAPAAVPTPTDALFSPPTPASPPTTTRRMSTPPGTPGSPRRNEDRPLSNGPAGVSRTGSGSQDGSKIRGPRGPAPPRGGGPRPLSLAGSARPAPPPGAGRAGSPRNSISNGSPGSAIADARAALRPRTPPDAKDYAPTKRGGRAAAGSFSRTRPAGDV